MTFFILTYQLINRSTYKKHVIAVTLFLAIAALYCRPALQGKVLVQPDVVYWKAMSHASFKYKEAHGNFPLWTNSMYCGMPGYLIAMDAYNPASITNLHNLYMWIFPKPGCFFFLLCIAFYFLSQVLNINPYLGILGGIAYSYASYSSIILAVGHETKMMAMGYGPALLGAILLIFQKRYWLGMALAIVFASLLLAVNHLQISYYYLLIALVLTSCYAVQWIKNKEYRHFFKSLTILLLAGCIGICANLVILATTYDYSKATRQGELNMTGKSKTATQSPGYSLDYAFNWSYGGKEMFTLLVPNIYGGKSVADLSESSNFIQTAIDKKTVNKIGLTDLMKDWPLYWGNQPSTSGPVYMGAVVCFLFVFGLLYVRDVNKWWIIIATVLGLCLSLGKNFYLFNAFIFEWLPFYNKFRAPSMTLIIPQLLFPLLGIMALQKLLFEERDQQFAWKKLKISGYILAGILLTAFYFYLSFDYIGPRDKAEAVAFIKQIETNQNTVDHLYQALLKDRRSLFGYDLLRSTILVAFNFSLLAAAVKYRLKPIYVIGGLWLLTGIDLLSVGKRYLEDDLYQQARDYDKLNFAPTVANLEIMKDTGFYRVADEATYTDPRTYYYHHDMAGNSPVILTLMQDLIRFQEENPQLMNILNVKYIIKFNPKQELVVERNKGALGNCWLVRSLHFVRGPVNEMNAMNHFVPKDTAIVDEMFRHYVIALPQRDSTAGIQLIRNYNDSITYRSKGSTPQFAVFSEVFYDRGWLAYIDDKPSPIIKANYAMRGLSIPPGEHLIRFVFKPASYYESLSIARIASWIGWLIILFALWRELKEMRNKKLEIRNKEVQNL